MKDWKWSERGIAVFGVLILLLVLFAASSPEYFRNFGFKMRYDTIAFFGTREKMDAINSESIDAVKKNGGELTIIVHGTATEYYQDVYGTALLFRERGLNVVSFDYDYKADPDISAQRLSRYVEMLRAETGVGKVNIIGICLGGMLVRYYVEQYDGARFVDHLITAGSPVNVIPATDPAYQYNRFFSFDPVPWNAVSAKIQGKSSVEKNMYIYCERDYAVRTKYQVGTVGNYVGMDCGHTFLSINPEILTADLNFITGN